jgi:hypothetical protein
VQIKSPKTQSRFFPRFCITAFLGISRKGEFENTTAHISEEKIFDPVTPLPFDPPTHHKGASGFGFLAAPGGAKQNGICPAPPFPREAKTGNYGPCSRESAEFGLVFFCAAGLVLLNHISVEIFYPTDLLYAGPRLPAPELRLQHLHRNRHFGLAWDYSGYIGPAKWAMSPPKVKRSLVNTIRLSPLAEN